MIFLRNFKTIYNKKYLALGLFFGILSIVSPVITARYGILLSIFFFILSFFFVLFANRVQKYFEGLFNDKITLKDTFHAVHRDKNGNIKSERQSS